MIISHKRKFIFLKTMKTAGTSLEIALSRHCGDSDILTPFGKKDEKIRAGTGFLSARNYNVPFSRYGPADWGRLAIKRKRIKLFHSHIGATELAAIIGDAVWNTYLKISVIRSPFELVISRYHWDIRLRKLPDFRTWLIANPEIILENQRITNIEGHDVVDFMIKYENAAEDLSRLSDSLGLPSNLYDDFKNISTKSNVRPKIATVEHHFSDFEQGIRLIQILCKEEISKYSYSVPTP